MSSVTVRTAEICDFSRIACLKSDAYSVRGYCSQSRAEQYLEHNKYALVAEKQKEIVGTMMVTYDEGEIPADEYFPEEMIRVRGVATRIAYYGSFAVKAGLWRLGIFSVGLALVCEAIRRALDDRIEVAVIIVNPRHVSFYETLGFEEKTRREEMPGLGVEGKVPGILMTVTRETFRDVLHQDSYQRVRRIQKQKSASGQPTHALHDGTT